MSTRNTYPSAVKLGEKYEGISEPLLDESIVLKLTKSLEDDINLRRFFIDNSFVGHFKKKGKRNELYEFVMSTRVFPSILAKHMDYELFNFFLDIRRNAADVFKKNLSRGFNEVCEKAENIGLFEAKVSILDTETKICLISSDAFSGTEGDLCGTFYKISESLFEYWIKPESKGKMLEAWVYGILKQHFGENHTLKIYCNLVVREQIDTTCETAEDLVSTTYKPDLTEIDCLIMKGDHVVIIIECKTGKTGPSDILKFYGLIKLINADFGVFIISNTDKFKTDQEFENIKIIPGVVNREDFPDILINYLEAKILPP